MGTVLRSRGALTIQTCAFVVPFLISLDIWDSDDVDDFFHYICSNDLKELKLKLYLGRDGPFCVPHHVFTCSSLLRLELSACIVKVPVDFQEFGSPKHLALK